jgi:hypothetical protein
MKIPLLQGRYFNEQDRHDGLGGGDSESDIVQRYFSGENPIGKRIIKDRGQSKRSRPRTMEIVGVVGDVHHSSLTKER